MRIFFNNSTRAAQIGNKLKGGWVDFFNNSADRQPTKQLSLLNQEKKPAANFSNPVLTHISDPTKYLDQVPLFPRSCVAQIASALQRPLVCAFAAPPCRLWLNGTTVALVLQRSLVAIGMPPLCCREIQFIEALLDLVRSLPEGFIRLWEHLSRHDAIFCSFPTSRCWGSLAALLAQTSCQFSATSFLGTSMIPRGL